MKPSMPKNKIVVFSTIIFLFVSILGLGVLEVASYILIAQKGKTFYLPSALEEIDAADIPEETRKTFSSSLGWEPNHPNEEGYRGDPKDVQAAALAVFGDSFTKGHPAIEKSWPHLLEQQLERPVLNFGVGGYGTDQAYLRFEERYAEKLETPYVALFIMAENIARTVNQYRGFYVRRDNVSFPKPMFHNDDGNITFLPNPITSPDEFTKLGDAQFLKDIGEKDYWFQYFDGYGLNQFAGFPYSYYLIKSLPYYAKRSYDRWIKHEYPYARLYDNERALETMDFIVDSFVSRATELSVVPIVGFLPQLVNMIRYQDTGKAVYQDYANDLKARGQFILVDGLDYFAPYLDQGDDPLSFFISAEDGHYNLRGETVVSEGLYQTLRDVDVDKNLIGFGGKSEQHAAQ